MLVCAPSSAPAFHPRAADDAALSAAAASRLRRSGGLSPDAVADARSDPSGPLFRRKMVADGAGPGAGALAARLARLRGRAPDLGNPDPLCLRLPQGRPALFAVGSRLMSKTGTPGPASATARDGFGRGRRPQVGSGKEAPHGGRQRVAQAFVQIEPRIAIVVAMA